MRKLRSLLREVIATIEDKTLVRAQLGDFRIKKLPSLQRKANNNRWKDNEAFTRCGDLIGGRVVCNNVDDVYRFVELLKERLPGDHEAFEVQDWIAKPNERGYRALHVNLRLDVSDGFAPDLIPCEVQIRTRLQDAWGELTHDDIYKQPELPTDLQARGTDLAEVLAAADKIASDIRRRAVQETTAPEQRPDLRTVSAGGLAFVFREIFGRSPPDYVVRQALNMCEDLEISSLARLQEILMRTDFRDELAEAYHAIIHVRPGPDDVFLAALYAIARGDRGAMSYIRRKARREFREIDAVYRREMLSSLPGSIEELMSELEEPGREPNVESWAAALESTTDSCMICGTTIIRPDAFAEAIVQHYEPSDPGNIYQRIVNALYQSGVECGGSGRPSLCSYHADRADKD
jgi:putative GTP pyrophosphokinase